MYEKMLDTLLNVCKAHSALQGMNGLITSGEIIGATVSLSEMVNNCQLIEDGYHEIT